jgi:hypothetical protein
MSEHHGSCHCGRIKLLLRDTPRDAGECNCSMCRRLGGLWHYCPPDKLTVEGDAVAYRQGDCSLDTWRCQICGCTTHWTPTDPAYQRVGVNLRMFDPALWSDLPRRFIDGASF